MVLCFNHILISIFGLLSQYLRLAEEHNSDYSKVALTNQIGSLISSLIPALVLVDAEEGSGGELHN